MPPNLVPVDDDPFAAAAPSISGGSAPNLMPVDEDPFSGTGPVPAAAPLSWGDIPGKAAGNLLPSAVNLAENLAQPIMHPVDTAASLYDIGRGLYSKMQGAVGVEQDPAEKARNEAAADAVGHFFVNRYGSIDRFKQTLATDPVGVLADAATVLTGPEMVAGRAPGLIGQAARVAGTAGRAVDPLVGATKLAGVAGKVARYPLAVTTGVAPENIALAGRAGMEGNQAFLNQMRGTADVEQPIDLANSAVQQMVGERRAAYNAGMAGVRNDPTQLDYSAVNRAIADARNMTQFKGVSKSAEADKVLNDIEDKVAEWQSMPPGPHHTAEGFDALKQAVGEIRNGTDQGTLARTVGDNVYNAVKNAITKQAPDYAATMKGYAEASDQLKQMRKTLSLNEKATKDTTLRKLQSLMRNDVNTNFGARAKLGAELASREPDLPYALAGQTMGSWLPRGLARAVTGLGGLGAFAHPAMLPALAMSSPRLVGEGAYLAGRALNVAPRLAPIARLDNQVGRVVRQPLVVPITQGFNAPAYQP